jgi:hypothetical protein
MLAKRVSPPLAEAAPEGLLLIGRDVLIAEEDHLVVDQGVVHPLERGLVEGAGEIDAVHLRADVRRELGDGELLAFVRGSVHGDPPWARSCLAACPASSRLGHRQPAMNRSREGA